MFQKSDSLLPSLLSVTGQRYETHILPESVIRGNDVLFRCSIPSFVSDWVAVDRWVETGTDRQILATATADRELNQGKTRRMSRP